MTGHKERRDSTDSDKENEFESLIQFPDNSNVLNLLPQVHKEKFFRNEESAIDSVRNIEENYAEENLDNLCDLFIGYNLLVRKIKELLFNNFVSNAKESTTFSMNTGPDFGGSC